MTEKFRKDVIQVCSELSGWCTPAKAVRLCELIEESKPNTVVEIGVWGGKSLIPMAMALREFKCGSAWAIDPWSAFVSVVGYEGDNALWWGSQDHEAVYQGFAKSLSDLGLTEYVTIHRAKSDDVTAPAVVNLLHIDGAHTEQAIRDVKRYAVNVPSGGIVIMDDINWVNAGVPHVSMAVTALSEMGFVAIEPLETGAVFRRLD